MRLFMVALLVTATNLYGGQRVKIWGDWRGLPSGKAVETESLERGPSWLYTPLLLVACRDDGLRVSIDFGWRMTVHGPLHLEYRFDDGETRVTYLRLPAFAGRSANFGDFPESETDQVLQLIRKSMRMVVRGYDSEGEYFMYTFSLKGSSAALNSLPCRASGL